jgi:hypothetical protein
VPPRHPQAGLQHGQQCSNRAWLAPVRRSRGSEGEQRTSSARRSRREGTLGTVRSRLSLRGVAGRVPQILTVHALCILMACTHAVAVVCRAAAHDTSRRTHAALAPSTAPSARSVVVHSGAAPAHPTQVPPLPAAPFAVALHPGHRPVFRFRSEFAFPPPTQRDASSGSLLQLDSRATRCAVSRLQIAHALPRVRAVACGRTKPPLRA